MRIVFSQKLKDYIKENDAVGVALTTRLNYC